MRALRVDEFYSIACISLALACFLPQRAVGTEAAELLGTESHPRVRAARSAERAVAFTHAPSGAWFVPLRCAFPERQRTRVRAFGEPTVERMLRWRASPSSYSGSLVVHGR